MRAYRWCWGITLTVLFLACTGTDTGNPIVDGGFSDETETTAMGTIVDSTGTPVSQCSLWLRPLPAQNALIKTLAKVKNVVDKPYTEELLITDKSGEFEFRRVPAGEHVIMAKSNSLQKGIQVKFSVGKGDTFDLGDSIILTPLTSQTFTRDPSWIGDSVWIPELALRVKLGDTPLILEGLPEGSYTIVPDSIQPTSSSSFISSSSSALIVSSSSITDPNQLIWNGSSGSIQDERSMDTYGLIKQSGIYWFTSNLRYKTTASTCNPNDEFYSTQACLTYGRFYSFEDANTNACPTAWSVPTQENWDTLIASAGGTLFAGTNLKAKTAWVSAGVGTDLLGFSVIPAGSAALPSLGTDAWFWTSTSVNADTAVAVHFSTAASVEFVHKAKDQALSLRCIKATPYSENGI